MINVTICSIAKWLIESFNRLSDFLTYSRYICIHEHICNIYNRGITYSVTYFVTCAMGVTSVWWQSQYFWHIFCLCSQSFEKNWWLNVGRRMTWKFSVKVSCIVEYKCIGFPVPSIIESIRQEVEHKNTLAD
jgi:hypothetical protein